MHFQILSTVVILAQVTAFAPSFRQCDVNKHQNCAPIFMSNSESSSDLQTRSNFLSTSTSAIIAASFFLDPSPAYARGRATLEASYDRYTPRILAGGQFYAKDLRKLIEKNDWNGIKLATSEPPKRSKEDKSKVDGGIQERASKAGGFSDARVLVAADLFAASFSDNSVSTKTKNMKEKVVKLRVVIQEMNLAARRALGEEKAEGGLFGFGAKQPSANELANTVRKLYIEGGNEWNEYIFAANDSLPVQLKKLPYL